MDRSYIYLRLALAALRMEGHHVPESDADAAQMIADGLEILDPDSGEAADDAEALAISFAMLAQDIRDEEEDQAEAADGRALFESRYAARVRELEAEGMTTSDAQAVADAELQP